MKYNLHTHSFRCNHATGTDRAYVEAAIRAGMQVLGFSDHCPQFFPTKDYYSYFRMLPEQAFGYAESVRAKILLGFETEYYPETFEPFMAFVRQLHLDYLIMGQHFVGNEYDEGSYYAASEGKKEAYLDQYVKQVKEGLDKGVFTYVAHPDIVWYGGDRQFYDDRMRDLCRFAKERDIPLEWNLLVAETGNKVVVGFDAHSPQMLGRTQLYEECLGLLNARGITPVPFEEIHLRHEKL